MLSFRTLALPLTLLCGLALSACTGEEDDGDGDDGGNCNAAQSGRLDTILALTADETAGATTFAATCGNGGCHGADGNSGPAPALSDEVAELTDSSLGCLLLTGVGSMPAQSGLSDQELADVIAYVMATF